MEVTVIGHSVYTDNVTGDTYTVFDLECESENKKWIVQKRYSELLELHNKIKSLYGKITAIPFPEKYYISNFDSKKIMVRCGKLDAYLADLMRCAKHYPEVSAFFKVGSNYRNNMTVRDIIVTKEMLSIDDTE
ncbi:sorting nexin-29 [Acrasis kona]|uniref:Sorting nexin-29 n=1 Tax=Acrasis kona TaxID=1008807 RepID=A0AAW2ZRV8_9EUKA